MSAAFVYPALARRYVDFVRSVHPARRIAEEELFPVEPVASNELAWQSRWFAGDFGRSFTTADGRSVKIIQFGWWNHGAGPDFRDAVVEIGGQHLKGSIELDLDARDWERHGHAENPAYEDVALHLHVSQGGTEFFTRTAAHRNVAQVVLDGTAPPVERRERPPESFPGRCSLVIQTWNAERIDSLLKAAARFRLEKKSQRWRRIANIHGWDQAAYQGFAEALGYSRNKLPMTVLAQRFPLKFLQQHKDEREALLFGAAGFMEGIDFSAAADDTRGYLRTLWETWWKLRPEYAPSAQAQTLKWNLSGVRPMNHPQRRVAALSELAANWKRLRAVLQPPEAFHEDRFAEALDAVRHPYWDHHFTLASAASAKRMALIGGTRAGDFLANLVYPLLVPEREALWNRYCDMAAPLENEKSRRAALRVLGGRPDAAAFTRKVYHQQALLQIYQDFCLTDSTDCAGCPFPEQLAQW